MSSKILEDLRHHISRLDGMMNIILSAEKRGDSVDSRLVASLVDRAEKALSAVKGYESFYHRRNGYAECVSL